MPDHVVETRSDAPVAMPPEPGGSAPAPSTARRMVIMLVVVGLLLGGLVAWNVFKASMMKKYMAAKVQPPQTVSAVTASMQTWQPGLSQVGTLRAVRGVDIAPDISGVVTDVRIKAGDLVKKGDVLVRMRVDDDLARLHGLRSAQRLAELDFTRSKSLLSTKTIAQAQYDADATRLEGAKAAVAEQAALIARKTLRAPFAGRVGISTVNPGEYLSPGEVVVTLQQLDSLYVDFRVPQRSLGELKVGGAVHVSVDAFGDRAFDGKITAINPKVDIDTRDALVEALVPNPEAILVPGMFGRVEVDVGTPKQYLTLPRTAVAYNPYGQTVFVVEEQHTDHGAPTLAVRQVFVNTGEVRGGQVAISDGLRSGDKVVTTGQMKLKNGSPVVLSDGAAPPDSSSTRLMEN